MFAVDQRVLYINKANPNYENSENIPLRIHRIDENYLSVRPEKEFYIDKILYSKDKTFHVYKGNVKLIPNKILKYKDLL